MLVAALCFIRRQMSSILEKLVVIDCIIPSIDDAQQSACGVRDASHLFLSREASGLAEKPADHCSFPLRWAVPLHGRELQQRFPPQFLIPLLPFGKESYQNSDKKDLSMRADVACLPSDPLCTTSLHVQTDSRRCVSLRH